MKTIWAMMLGALLLGHGAQAQSWRGASGTELLVGLRDLDQDGRVSWDEAWLFALADFEAVDRDGSGDLTPDEFESLLVVRVAEEIGLLGGPASDIRPSGIRLVGGLPEHFRDFDADGDGVVTLEELHPFVAAEFLLMEVKGD